jgi:two-component system cell cycle response regulator DivK
MFSAIMIPAETGQDMALVPVTKRKDIEMVERVDPPAILYIEDNLPNRVLVKRILKAEGYEVLEAETGPEGIEIAKARQLSLILVDINLPEVDGYEVTAQLRAMNELRDVPIIALTANVMRGDREKSLEAGCSGYIQKPVDVDLLPSQVAAYLEK